MRCPPAGRSVPSGALRTSGSGDLLPARWRTSGSRKRNAVTNADDGLPGSPKTIAEPSRPAITGFPGRIATFQKSISAPTLRKAFCTRSWSPTDAPPLVTIMFEPAQSFSAASRSARLSATMPLSSTSQGRRSSIAASMTLFDDGICAASQGWPGGNAARRPSR